MLLDTHTFIWWDTDPDKLSPNASMFLHDDEHELLFSVASAWEMQIKLQLGKLKLEIPLAEMIEAQQRINGLEILPIALSHVLALGELPSHHKDPFDRLLIAQANAEGATLVSRDSVFAEYSVNVVW